MQCKSVVLLFFSISISLSVIAQIDVNYYYRLTNTFLGEGRSLDTYGAGSNDPFMGQTGNYTGQFWKLTPLSNGYYRLTNSFLGEGRSLDTYGAGSNDPFMGQTGNYTGQFWKLTTLSNGHYRLTNSFLGEGRSLDTYSDGSNKPFMGQTGNYSGQRWILTKVKPITPASPVQAPTVDQQSQEKTTSKKHTQADQQPQTTAAAPKEKQAGVQPKKPAPYFPKENTEYRIMSFWTALAVRKKFDAEPNGAELKLDRAYNKYDYQFEYLGGENYRIKLAGTNLYIVHGQDGGYRLAENSTSEPAVFTLVLARISDDRSRAYFRIESVKPGTNEKVIMTIPQQNIFSKPVQQTSITDNKTQQLFYFEYQGPMF